jgi:hypothetical protein|tara:strand:- start:422 stop:1615 length:1194 start_codon:yes stop_codon:yes gene_type:complete
MLDRKKTLYKITKNRKFNINVMEPFNNLSIDFLDDFSKEIKKNQRIYKFPDLIYLVFWTNYKKVKEVKEKLISKNLRLGRGLIYHICPSNVPTNFIYSFFFGLLSGNSNIVKVPSKSFPEKNIILSGINKLFKKKKYLPLKNSNFFIQYDEKIENTRRLSSICDGRIIWGGDKTINEVRKIWIPERAVELTFADRYSLSILDLSKFTKIKDNEIKLVAKKFFYDSYMLNQSACNSPHFVFWVGKKNNNFQQRFWNELNNIAKEKFVLNENVAVNKYLNLITNIINQKDFQDIKFFKNNLYVVNPNQNIKNIEDIRGLSGIFFQKNIRNLSELKKFITKKCQTVTYFGLNKEQIKSFLLRNNLLGIDRVVPIGKALDINLIWDGYDVIDSLSRIITIE